MNKEINEKPMTHPEHNCHDALTTIHFNSAKYTGARCGICDTITEFQWKQPMNNNKQIFEAMNANEFHELCKKHLSDLIHPPKDTNIKHFLSTGNVNGIFLFKLHDLCTEYVDRLKPIPQQPEQHSEYDLLRHILDDIEFGYDAEMIKNKILNSNYGQIARQEEQQADGGGYINFIEQSAKDDGFNSFHALIWEYCDRDETIYSDKVLEFFNDCIQQAVQQEREISNNRKSKIEQLFKELKRKDLIIYGLEDGADEWVKKCHDLEWKVNQLQSQLEQTKARKVKWPEYGDGRTMPDWMNTHKDGWNDCINEFKRLNPEVE